MIYFNFDIRPKPCSFAPLSDVNLHEFSLKEALNSDLMGNNRNNHSHLEHNHKVGCTLWEHREWLDKMKKEKEILEAL